MAQVICQNRLAHDFNSLEETWQRLEISLDDFPCTEAEESYRPVNWPWEIVALEASASATKGLGTLAQFLRPFCRANRGVHHRAVKSFLLHGVEAGDGRAAWRGD